MGISNQCPLGFQILAAGRSAYCGEFCIVVLTDT